MADVRISVSGIGYTYGFSLNLVEDIEWAVWNLHPASLSLTVSS